MQIILADHHPQALWALKIMLQETPRLEVIGEVTDACNLLTLAVDNPPDLILLDWELPGKPIDDLITELHMLTPQPVVVVMGSRPEHGRTMLKAGADVFISKSDQPDWLLETLQKFENRLSERDE